MRQPSELGARFVQLDVTDDASVAAAFAQIEAGGGLDVLVNNAGIGMVALNGPDALRVFDTNAVGIIRVTEAALPLLRRSENPVVVNISSALGSFWANHEPSRPASRSRPSSTARARRPSRCSRSSTRGPCWR